MKITGNNQFSSLASLSDKLSKLTQKSSSTGAEKSVNKASSMSLNEILSISNNPDQLATQLEQAQDRLSLYQTIGEELSKIAQMPEDQAKKALENIKFNGKNALEMAGISSDKPISEISKEIESKIKDTTQNIKKLAVTMENLTAYSSQGNFVVLSELLNSEGISSLNLSGLSSETTNSLLQPIE